MNGRRRRVLTGGQHGLRDGWSGFRVGGEAGDGGARTAQEATQSSGGFPCGHDLAEAWIEGFPVGLVQGVLHEAPEGWVIARGKSGGDGGGVSGIGDRLGKSDLPGQDTAGVFGADFVTPDEQDQAKTWIDGETESAAIWASDKESAKYGRSGIVRVTLERGALVKKVVEAQRFAVEGIESGQQPKPQSDAAAQASGDGYIA